PGPIRSVATPAPRGPTPRPRPRRTFVGRTGAPTAPALATRLRRHGAARAASRPRALRVGDEPPAAGVAERLWGPARLHHTSAQRPPAPRRSAAPPAPRGPPPRHDGEPGRAPTRRVALAINARRTDAANVAASCLLRT